MLFLQQRQSAKAPEKQVQNSVMGSKSFSLAQHARVFQNENHK